MFEQESPIEGYVNWKKVSSLMNKQNQYSSRYLWKESADYPYLGEGLRIVDKKGNPITQITVDDYHNIWIHNEDISVVIARWKAYLKGE